MLNVNELTWSELSDRWKRSGWRCTCGCHDFGPVLKNYVWARLSTHYREIICYDLMVKRMGRDLRPYELKDVPWNKHWLAEHSLRTGDSDKYDIHSGISRREYILLNGAED